MCKSKEEGKSLEGWKWSCQAAAKGAGVKARVVGKEDFACHADDFGLLLQFRKQLKGLLICEGDYTQKTENVKQYKLNVYLF